MFAVAHTVDTGLEELVENVIFVCRHHKSSDRQSHLLGNPAGQDISEVTRRNRDVNHFTGLFCDFQPALEVIDDLRRNAGPVDGIDRADVVRRFKSRILTAGLNNVLRVVKRTFDRDIEDVGVLEAVHLGSLKRAHASLRREHEDAHAFAPAHGVFGSRPGIPRCGPQNIEFRVALFEDVFKERSKVLHRHVFEGKRRAIGKFQNANLAAVNGPRRRDLGKVLPCTAVVVDILAVHARKHGLERIFLNIGCKQTQDLKRKFCVGQMTPILKIGLGDLRINAGHEKTAVGRKSLEHDVTVARALVFAARGLIGHCVFDCHFSAPD